MASLNLNKAILVGRLTADPELKNTSSGTPVTTFTVAVNRRAAKDGQEQQTDFINCVAWRNTAEFVCKYFNKGASICVIGSIQVRKYTTQNNENRYSTEIVVDEARFVAGKSDTTAAKQINDNYMPEAYQTAPSLEEIAVNDDLPF